jgi:RNA polymerase sigma-70 factor (ECF subfamily)
MRANHQLTDASLTDLLKAGDESAFTEIYHRYWHKLLAIAYHYTKDKSIAEEVLQEVFISLWERKKLVDIQSLNNYLATAVKFAVFKSLTRRKKHLEIDQSKSAPALVSTDNDVIDARFLQDYINGIVEQLPEKCRLVFKYSRTAGMSIPEIAQEMKIAEKTVEAHLSKALKTIRLQLGSKGALFILIGSKFLS